MTLEEFARKIEALRLCALFGDGKLCDGKGPVDPANVDSMDPVAEQEFLQSIAFLELAERAASKAQFHQARALAVSPYRQ